MKKKIIDLIAKFFIPVPLLIFIVMITLITITGKSFDLLAFYIYIAIALAVASITSLIIGIINRKNISGKILIIEGIIFLITSLLI